MTESTHRLVLEIEIPDFWVDGSTQKVCDEFECELIDIVREQPIARTQDSWMASKIDVAVDAERRARA